MTSWRTDLAVLTDLSASMFVACFMILLIFLSLVQSQAPAPESALVEANEAFDVVRRAVPSSAAMVEQLYRHRHAVEGASVDLFADRVAVALPGRGEVATGEGTAELEAALAAAPPGPLRVFVFSNEIYLPAVAILARSGRGWAELSVPFALRDRAAPDRNWSQAFTALEASTPDPQAFRAGLAAILDAAAGERRPSTDGGFAASDAGVPAAAQEGDLLERFRAWLSRLAALVAAVLGVAAVVLIERRRFTLPAP